MAAELLKVMVANFSLAWVVFVPWKQQACTKSLLEIYITEDREDDSEYECMQFPC